MRHQLTFLDVMARFIMATTSRPPILQTETEASPEVIFSEFGMAQKPPVLVNIMHAEFYPYVLPFRQECYDSIAL
jgi:hypothetical protein